MILANISIPLLGMVDTAVIGHLDSAHYLGGVAVGSLIFSFLFWGFGFLRMATTGLTAQAEGDNNDKLSLKILQHSLLLALLIAIGILLLQSPLSILALSIIDSSELVLAAARTYFDIRIWSTPAILINYVILGWLIGKGASKHALVLVLTVTISNIVLDILFVNTLGMKVDGVALASVIAEYLGLFVAIKLLLTHGVAQSLFVSDPDTYLHKQNWLTLHGNIFIRTLCLIFSIAFFTAQGAKQGELILAANAILVNFIVLMAFVLDGFANAIEVISGKAIGSKNKHQLVQGLRLSAIWTFGLACFFSMSYLLFGSQLILLLTSISAVNALANEYLIWLIIMPLIAVWSFLFDGLFIGATRSVEMRNSMLFATFICYLPAWYFLQDYGNHGLWVAFLIFFAARGLGQAFYLPKILSLK
ncbi:MAG: MATE family efflux transporter [Piscirickettsiaceae bacterium]|nr:MATE family efflux transporter [Piscirickettsiaceae bacterium]